VLIIGVLGFEAVSRLPLTRFQRAPA
jgi:hypothetical protein